MSHARAKHILTSELKDVLNSEQCDLFQRVFSVSGDGLSFVYCLRGVSMIKCDVLLLCLRLRHPRITVTKNVHHLLIVGIQYLLKVSRLKSPQRQLRPLN